MRFALLMLLTGCSGFMEPLDERDCLTRQAFYPDPDGDGIGDPTTLIIACTAPDGYVTVLPEETTTETGLVPTGDTGA